MTSRRPRFRGLVPLLVTLLAWPWGILLAGLDGADSGRSAQSSAPTRNAHRPSKSEPGPRTDGGPLATAFDELDDGDDLDADGMRLAIGSFETAWVPVLAPARTPGEPLPPRLPPLRDLSPQKLRC